MLYFYFVSPRNRLMLLLLNYVHSEEEQFLSEPFSMFHSPTISRKPEEIGKETSADNINNNSKNNKNSLLDLFVSHWL